MRDVFASPEDLPRWWPAVYLDVRRERSGDADGVGAEYALFTKGWLPYTLRWRMRVLSVAPLRREIAAAGGDFLGRGVWTFAADGGHVDLTYDWDIEVLQPRLARWSWLLAPVFAANHRWAMARGEESMRIELERRRATDAERARLPAPPSPTFRPASVRPRAF